MSTESPSAEAAKQFLSKCGRLLEFLKKKTHIVRLGLKQLLKCFLRSNIFLIINRCKLSRNDGNWVVIVINILS